MAKTRDAAIESYRKMMGDKPGYVYQFPRGHWSACSQDSPVGKSLRRHGYIYTEIDCPAIAFEAI